MTVTDGSGATASKTVTITVAPAVGNVAPIVTTAFLPNPHGNPLEVDFTAEADDPNGDPVTFEWDFDDSSAKKAGGSTSHIYAAGGTYNVKVTASDGKGGKTTETIAVTVSQTANVLPTLDVLADPGQGTGPLVVRFSSQASDPDSPDPLKYTWAFGDGGFSAEPNPVHTYLAAGVYTADAHRRGPARRRHHEVADDHGHGGRRRRSRAEGPGRGSGAGAVVRRQRAGQDVGERVRQERPGGPRHSHAGHERHGRAWWCRARSPSS